MPRHLHIDPFSGIAGDMFLGALIDAGADADQVRHALAPLPIRPGYRLETARVHRHSIGATDVKVVIEDEHRHDHDHGHHDGSDHDHHHHVTRDDIFALIDHLDTTDRARQRARRIVDALASAESQVHGIPLEKVHFHEVGAVDSIVDMLGSAAALELLDVATVSCGPLPVGRGFVQCQHGTLPLPAPATAYLLRGMLTVGVDREVELVTPTGAAIVAGVCDRFGPPPMMAVHAVGYGAADRDDPDVPNLLRVFIGELHDAAAPAAPAT